MNTTHPKVRAAIYIRVSSEDQKKGYGPDIQLEETRRAAVDRDGCVVRQEHIFLDAKTGQNDDRPDWKRLLQTAQQREIDVVYFWKLDRMMRDEFLFYLNEKAFKDCGVALRFATQNLDDPFSKAVQVAAAAEERRKIAERTYKGRLMALKDGKWVAPPPFGYVIDEDTKTLRIHAQEAQWLTHIFEVFVRESLSLGALGEWVYSQRIPTKYDRRQKKKPRHGPYFWSKGMLSRLLSRDYYASGEAWFHKYVESDRKRFDNPELRPQADWILVPVPPIIPKALFEKARKQLLTNRESARRRTKRQYLFQRKVRCGVCKYKLSANCRKGREHSKFYRGDAWSEDRCSNCRYYLEKDLDTTIWPKILAFFRNPESFLRSIERYQQQGSRKGDIEQEQKRVQKLAVKMSEMEKALIEYELEGFYSKSTIAEKRETIKEQRRQLEDRSRELGRLIVAESRKRETIDSAQVLYERLRRVIETPDYMARQQVYEALIDRIVVREREAEVWMNVPILSSPEMSADGGVKQQSSGISVPELLGTSGRERTVSYKERDANGTKEETIPIVFMVELLPRAVGSILPHAA